MGSVEFPRGVEAVVSTLIENSSGEILLVQSPKWHDKWIFPGGHIEPGERIFEAARREAAEEVGLDVEPVAIVSGGEVIATPDFHRPAHLVYFTVLCRASSVDVQVDGQEITSFQWLKPSEALAMDLAEGYEKKIKDYLDYRANHP